MIYTSYWSKLKYIPYEIEPISICLYPPKGVWRSIKEFMPDKNSFYQYKSGIITLDILFEKFIQQINRLDINNIELKDNSVLLCYEKEYSLCHRSIVSQWLNDNGIECKEWNE